MNRTLSVVVPVFVVTGYLAGLGSLHAQTVGNPNSTADTKYLNPTVASASSAAPEHINLWNEDQAQYQVWNFHAQNTDIIQGDPSFPAKYSGPNSLDSRGEIQETVTLDLFAGARLWPGAEVHADALMWQGFGLSQTFGIEAFPNGDAYKSGTHKPDYTFAHLFIRQTIGLGGPQEQIADDQLALAGKEDISRLTITLGRFSPLDMFDNNAYADDQHMQFMNWAMMGNLAWDYGQDTVGFTTGIAFELKQPDWALRYSFFQMPKIKNGFTGDDEYLMSPEQGAYGPFCKSWAMATEYERDYSINDHPGKVRLLGWLDEADFANYNAATEYLEANPPGPNAPGGSGGDIPSQARAFRLKYGFGLNLEQEVAKDVGVFSRLGWNDGHEETWTFTDVNWSASLGASLDGDLWSRSGDTIGLAGIISGFSSENQRFLEAGGEDMLDGDGALNYAPEKVIETYYSYQICKHVHLSFDYQFVDDPACNRDRGPVSIFAGRLNAEF